MSGDGSRGVLENLYENFVARDLTFIFGGGVVSASFLFLIDRCPPKLLSSVMENLVYIIIFIITSYFIGVFCHELFYRCNIVKAPQEKIKKRDVMFLETEAQQAGNGFLLRRIERLIFIKQIFGVVGSCAFVSMIMLGIKIMQYMYYMRMHDIHCALKLKSMILILIIFMVMESIGICSVWLNRSKWKDLNGYYEQLDIFLKKNK